MRNTLSIATALVGAAMVTGQLSAQNSAADYRDAVLAHFNQSTRKLELLSQAIPAELYTWRPGEGVMSIAQVYMHIARYNYMYLEENLGIEAPSDVDWPNFESITDKETVVELLRRSNEHVRDAALRMSADDLTRQTTLYGRSVPGWAVLLQLVAHMNEHLGQSIAYARMNDVVPPWSR